MNPRVLDPMWKHYEIVSIKYEIGIGNNWKPTGVVVIIIIVAVEARNRPRVAVRKKDRKRNRRERLSITTWSKKKVMRMRMVPIGKRKCLRRDRRRISYGGSGQDVPVVQKIQHSQPQPRKITTATRMGDAPSHDRVHPVSSVVANQPCPSR